MRLVATLIGMTSLACGYVRVSASRRVLDRQEDESSARRILSETSVEARCTDSSADSSNDALRIARAAVRARDRQTWRSEALPAEDQVQLRAALAAIADFVRVAQTVAVDVPSGVWRGCHG